MAKEKTFTTKPTSQVDLEARLKNDNNVDDSVKTVNPNPLGEGDYIGTDPMYQTREGKGAAQSGPDKLAEKDFKSNFDLSDVDKKDLVDDPGFGGKAQVSRTDAGPIIEELPGQFDD